MRQRFLIIVGFLIVTLLVLAGLSLRISQVVNANRETYTWFGDQADQLNTSVLQTEFHVAQSFTRDSDELINRDIDEALSSAATAEQVVEELLRSEYLRDLSQIIRIAVAVPPDGSSGAAAGDSDSNPETKPDSQSLRQALETLAVGLAQQVTAINTVRQLATEIHHADLELGAKRKELSLKFRTLDPGKLQAVSRKGWADLSRAVLTVLSSGRGRDLNYLRSGGKAKFESAVKELGGAFADDPVFGEVTTLFEETHELAEKVAAVATSLAYENFTNAGASALRLGSQVNEAAILAQTAATSEMIDQVNAMSWFSLLIALICAVIGAAVTLVTVQGIIAKLRGAIAMASTQTRRLKTVSSTVEKASQSFGHSVSEQSTSIHETVAAMKEVSAMIASTHKEAGHVAEVSQDLDQKMQQLRQAASSLQNIVHSFNEIEEKTKMINEIVFKTQLLSFNASIEAARAGAQGKGFTVVAQEVGKLADMSGSAAKEINLMLERSSSQVREVVGTTSSAVEAFQAGLQQMATAARSIVLASNEQEAGVGQTSKAMERLQDITQENLEESQRLLSVSSQLSHCGGQINASVDDLRGVIERRFTTGVAAALALLKRLQHSPDSQSIIAAEPDDAPAKGAEVRRDIENRASKTVDIAVVDHRDPSFRKLD